jgi:Flp pilus assembly protein TadB
MISILSIAGWLGTLWGRVAIGAAALAAVVIWRQVDKSRLRAEGRQIERQATEEANAQAAQTADRVRRKSVDRSVRGVVDPHVID